MRGVTACCHDILCFLSAIGGHEQGRFCYTTRENTAFSTLLPTVNGYFRRCTKSF